MNDAPETDDVVGFEQPPVELYKTPQHEWRVENVITAYRYINPWWRPASWHEITQEQLEVRFLCSFHHARYYLAKDGRVILHQFLAPFDDAQGRTMVAKPRGMMSYYISGFMLLPNEQIPSEVVAEADIARLQR